ncbi:Cytochrome P450 [Colletotrichum asianum]
MAPPNPLLDAAFTLTTRFTTLSPYLLLPIILTTILILNSALRSLLLAQKARRLSCKPPPLEPTTLPLGIDTVLASLRADREQRTPDHVAARFAALGVHTFRIALLGTTNLVTADPRNVQALLATQFADFGMGAARSTNLKAVLGRSIFAADGPAWRSAREMMRPLFSRDNVSRLDLLEAHVQTLFRCIERDASETTGWTSPVSLASLLPSLTLDSATELFLGQSTSTLAARLRDDRAHPGMAFHHAFERMLALLGVRMRLRSFYWAYGTAELRSCVKTLHAFVDDAIAASDDAQKRGDSLARYDFLTVLRSRRALVDTTLPCGGGPDGTSPVFVPAGTEVNFSTHVLHRRKDLWGPDADEFVPERWEAKRGAAGAAWHFAPFNGGPRICIGQQLALTEAGYVVVRMLQRYEGVEGLDVDPARDWHNFTVVCSPGSMVDRNEAVLCRLKVAKE